MYKRVVNRLNAKLKLNNNKTQSKYIKCIKKTRKNIILPCTKEKKHRV